jgi:hypothetical protein
MAPIKTCGCCGKTYTAQEWAALPLLGRMRMDGESLELRNCSCRSTLAMEVSP